MKSAGSLAGFTASVILLFLSLASTVIAALGDAVLDATNTAVFESQVGQGRPALVEFFAPW